MSNRLLQIESLLKRELSGVISRKLSDPRLDALISITAVDVSPDLREARVFVSVMPEQKQQLAVQALRHASGYIHSQLCEQVALRTVPHLHFEIDSSLKQQAEVFDAIRRGRQRDRDAALNEQDSIDISADDKGSAPEEPRS